MKPRLRGVLHLIATAGAAIAGAMLVGEARTKRAHDAVLVYAVTLVSLFGVSALYHVPPWHPTPRRWLRRLDHATIFVFIAGTYTPVSQRLAPDEAALVLRLVWGGAVLGVAQSVCWVDAPKPVTVATYLLLGWTMLPFAGEFYRALGLKPLGFIAAGGAAYTTGAVVYARERPDPFPRTFGYHEVFHALVIVAAAFHYGAIRLVFDEIR